MRISRRQCICGGKTISQSTQLDSSSLVKNNIVRPIRRLIRQFYTSENIVLLMRVFKIWNRIHASQLFCDYTQIYKFKINIRHDMLQWQSWLTKSVVNENRTGKNVKFTKQVYHIYILTQWKTSGRSNSSYFTAIWIRQRRNDVWLSK